jgi:hypothetical protein
MEKNKNISYGYYNYVVDSSFSISPSDQLSDVDCHCEQPKNRMPHSTIYRSKIICGFSLPMEQTTRRILVFHEKNSIMPENIPNPATVYRFTKPLVGFLHKSSRRALYG